MESFSISKSGQPFTAKDFNFWGVTFASDNDRFYSTLSSNRTHYLIRGSVKARTAQVIYENVECPSLSPDGTRVAYKKRLPGNRVIWQLQVLDLETLTETALSERRSVDDQLEWLDDARLLYSLPHSAEPGPSTDVWVTPANGKGDARLFLGYAYSPSVAR
jgi:WD40 repeat protein